MKTNLNIFIAAMILLGVQACGPKSESETAVAVVEPIAVEKAAPTAAERKARLETEKAAWTEKRRLRLEEQAAKSEYYTDPQGNIVYYKTQSSPVYAGGNDAMMAFLEKNLKYPEGAEEKGIEGTVFVDFVITKYGNVRSVQVTDATNDNVDQSFRNEAVRVVSAMPKWKPGNQNGANVDVSFSIPITFQIL